MKILPDVRETDHAKYFLLHVTKVNFNRSIPFDASLDNKNENK